jgi:DNA replication protein DnaC
MVAYLWEENMITNRCEKCGGETQSQYCEHCQGEIDHRRSQMVRHYSLAATGKGIPTRYHGANFDNLVVDDNNREAVLEAKGGQPNRGFLTLHGNAGTGKTWIACAMARARIIQDLPVKFVRCISMLNSIRSDFDRRERVNMTNLKNHPWLIIDDLGAEKRTDWVVEAMYDLLDYRYAWHR